MVLFGQENKNSNFHNSMLDLHNYPDKLLNQRNQNEGSDSFIIYGGFLRFSGFLFHSASLVSMI